MGVMGEQNVSRYTLINMVEVSSKVRINRITDANIRPKKEEEDRKMC